MPSVSSQPFFVFAGEQKRLLLHKRSENVCTFLANYNQACRDSSDTWSLEICWNTFFFFARQPFCSLHLHLEMSENPYTSGPVTSKKTVPGIIVATGRVA